MNNKNEHGVNRNDINIGKEVICTIVVPTKTGAFIPIDVKGYVAETQMLEKDDIIKVTIKEQITSHPTITVPANQTTAVWFDDVKQIL